MRITTVTQGPRRRILSHVVDLVGCAPWHVTRDWSAEELGVQLLENAQHTISTKKLSGKCSAGYLRAGWGFEEHATYPISCSACKRVEAANVTRRTPVTQLTQHEG